MPPPPNSSAHVRAVVVGGGVTGLMAARRLAQQDADVIVVVESSRRLGGQVHTVRFEGLPVDVGAEALLVASPAPASLLAELRRPRSTARRP